MKFINLGEGIDENKIAGSISHSLIGMSVPSVSLNIPLNQLQCLKIELQENDTFLRDLPDLKEIHIAGIKATVTLRDLPSL